MLGGGLALALAAHRDASERLLALERGNASLNAEVMMCAATSIGRGLHELAERENADLLVVGSRNRGLIGRVFLNDDTRASLNGASCAVAIAPRGYAENADGLVNIGVGYDGSPVSRGALGAARGLAARQGSPVRALSVVSIQDIPYGEPIRATWPEFAKQLVDDQLNSPGIVAHVTGDTTDGHPGEELARFSDELDLLIVGSRGYGPLERLLTAAQQTTSPGTPAVRCSYSREAPPRATSTRRRRALTRDLEREPSARLG